MTWQRAFAKVVGHMRRALSILLYASPFIVAGCAFLLIKNGVGVGRQAYASDWTATFIIEHIAKTGSWPMGWDDLRDEYDRLAVPEHYAWTFEELQTLIDVDWNVTINDIRESKVPLNNVRLKSGIEASYNGDPDRRIHDFIHSEEPYQFRERIGGTSDQ